MQRDILIFQNPVIVKGHNIFSLITPKATHVNKARERVKEISEFRQLHDRFKGEVVDGCCAPALEQEGSSACARGAAFPGMLPPSFPALCCLCCLCSLCQEPSRVLSLQGNRAVRAMQDGWAKSVTVEETATIGWPELHRQQHCPKFLSEPQLMFLGKKPSLLSWLIHHSPR